MAVVTDNDGDAQTHCTEKYKDFVNDSNIKIFFESDNHKKTFEIVLYNDNRELFDWIFEGTTDIQDYMLKNKTESAFSLLDLDFEDENEQLIVPDYIRGAIEWIRE